MEENYFEEPKPFVDIKNQAVQPGDFIMYPVMTFLRCGVVQKVHSENSLTAKYIKGNYANNDRDLVIGRQMVNTYERSVLKITEDLLKSVVNRADFDYFISNSREVVEKYRK
jgi:hypothetical protein